MTWAKLGDQFADECADAGLSDGAFRLHAEAICWLYRIERDDCRILKHLIRRFAGGPDPDQAIKELLAARFWSDGGDAWVVRHHANIIRQSLAAQWAKRERDLKAQHKRRGKSDVSGDVSADTDADPAATQPTNQTTNPHRREADSDLSRDETCTGEGCRRPARRGCCTCWDHASLETGVD